MLVGLSHVKKVDYSILCTNPVSPAFHRLRSLICDFRPPSVTESGEAALRRLLASRAIVAMGRSTLCDTFIHVQDMFF